MSLTHSLHRQKRAKFDNYFSCRITFVNSKPKLKYLFTSTKVILYGYLGLPRPFSAKKEKEVSSVLLRASGDWDTEK